MSERFVNAYGEEMSPNAMIHQLMHRVSELEKESQKTNRQLSELNTQLNEHNHEE